MRWDRLEIEYKPNLETEEEHTELAIDTLEEAAKLAHKNFDAFNDMRVEQRELKLGYSAYLNEVQ